MSDAQKEALKTAREALRARRAEREEENQKPKEKKQKVVRDNDTAASFTLPDAVSGVKSSMPSTKTLLIVGGVVTVGALAVGGGYFAKNKYATVLKEPKNNAPNPAAEEAAKPPSHAWP